MLLWRHAKAFLKLFFTSMVIFLILNILARTFGVGYMATYTSVDSQTITFGRGSGGWPINMLATSILLTISFSSP